MLCEFECRMCGKILEIDLDAEKVKRWVEGELIQRVFPELPIETRELMISQTCGTCFEAMWPKDEEEEEEEEK